MVTWRGGGDLRSIVDIDDPERGAEEGNGFVFHHESDLSKTLQRAVQRKVRHPAKVFSKRCHVHTYDLH